MPTRTELGIRRSGSIKGIFGAVSKDIVDFMTKNFTDEMAKAFKASSPIVKKAVIAGIKGPLRNVGDTLTDLIKGCLGVPIKTVQPTIDNIFDELVGMLDEIPLITKSFMAIRPIKAPVAPQQEIPGTGPVGSSGITTGTWEPGLGGFDALGLEVGEALASSFDLGGSLSALSGLMDGLTSASDVATDGLQTVFTHLTGIGTEGATAVKDMGVGWQVIFMLIDFGIQQLQKYAKQWLAVVTDPYFHFFGQMLENLTKIVSAIMTPLEPFLEILSLIAELFSAALTPFIAILWEQLAPLIPELTSAFNRWIEATALFISENGPAFDELMKMLIDTFVIALEAVTPLIPSIGEMILLFMEMLPTIIGLIPILLELGLRFAMIGIQLIPTIPALVSLAASIVLLLEAIMPALPSLAQLIALIVGFVALIVSMVSEFLEWIGLWDVLRGALEGVNGALGWLYEVARDFLNLIQPGTAIERMGNAWDTFWRDIGGAISSGQNLFPTAQTGGFVKEGGAVIVHDNERIVPEGEGEGIVVNINGGVVARDLDDLARQIARKVKLYR